MAWLCTLDNIQFQLHEHSNLHLHRETMSQILECFVILIRFLHRFSIAFQEEKNMILRRWSDHRRISTQGSGTLFQNRCWNRCWNSIDNYRLSSRMLFIIFQGLLLNYPKPLAVETFWNKTRKIVIIWTQIHYVFRELNMQQRWFTSLPLLVLRPNSVWSASADDSSSPNDDFR